MERELSCFRRLVVLLIQCSWSIDYLQEVFLADEMFYLERRFASQRARCEVGQTGTWVFDSKRDCLLGGKIGLELETRDPGA